MECLMTDREQRLLCGGLAGLTCSSVWTLVAFLLAWLLSGAGDLAGSRFALVAGGIALAVTIVLIALQGIVASCVLLRTKSIS